MLKRLGISLLVLMAGLFLLAVLLIRWVKPAETLDLAYQDISIVSKLEAMLVNRKLEVRLSESEINDIVKKQLSSHRELPHDLEIDGAKLHLDGSRLDADVNVTWQERVPVGVHMVFSLAWQPPNLVITPQQADVRGKLLPASWITLPQTVIPLESYLPKLIGIRAVTFEKDAVVVQFKAFQ
ncbi:hypothetical protein [Paenibacillus whitsoniae]|uniref:DUF2140 family protein n=1 Tax=Paenibacillus whitsoniae TaxID=2496558 RepID=A0A430J4M3_9BACL|nr:hypothetical protein [Paenibacillus whitsoniae]RTE02233.1 hypothetical protein EJQ19_29705 [Paenibacillus whitsoniae]